MNEFDWQKIVSEYPWNLISVLTNGLYYFFVIIGAVLTFLYFKIKKVKVISINDIGGQNVIIQNITNNAIFIKSISMIVKGNDTKNKRIIILDSPDIIEPKSYHKINLDYSVHDIEESDTVKIKIEVHQKHTHKKRIK